MSKPKVIRVSKLDGARRQLDGAIQLWFSDGDPVAIHTLVCAAHQIIEDLNKKRGDISVHLEEIARKTFGPESLEDVLRQIKGPMTFFKHANRDPDNILEFNPDLSELFILLAIKGIALLGERMSGFQFAALFWTMIHNPRLVQKDGPDRLKDLFNVQQIRQLRLVKKCDFLKECSLALIHARR